jgi:hypothetical protein
VQHLPAKNLKKHKKGIKIWKNIKRESWHAWSTVVRIGPDACSGDEKSHNRGVIAKWIAILKWIAKSLNLGDSPLRILNLSIP